VTTTSTTTKPLPRTKQREMAQPEQSLRPRHRCFLGPHWPLGNDIILSLPSEPLHYQGVWFWLTRKKQFGRKVTCSSGFVFLLLFGKMYMAVASDHTTPQTTTFLLEHICARKDVFFLAILQSVFFVYCTHLPGRLPAAFPIYMYILGLDLVDATIRFRFVRTVALRYKGLDQQKIFPEYTMFINDVITKYGRMHKSRKGRRANLLLILKNAIVLV
jgi:hypothetical protein